MERYFSEKEVEYLLYDGEIVDRFITDNYGTVVEEITVVKLGVHLFHLFPLHSKYEVVSGVAHYKAQTVSEFFKQTRLVEETYWVNEEGNRIKNY